MMKDATERLNREREKVSDKERENGICKTSGFLCKYMLIYASIAMTAAEAVLIGRCRSAAFSVS